MSTDQAAIRELAPEQENQSDARLRALVIIMRAAFDSMGVPTMGDVNRYCLHHYRFTPAIDADDWEEFFLMAWREVCPSLWNIDIDPAKREPTIRWVDDKPAP